jgi:recombinational DNA repair ATPase RecF
MHFRHMKNIEIQFGDYLTILSGLNGTGKSTVLGLVGQLFDYKGKKGRKTGKFLQQNIPKYLSFVNFMTKRKSINIMQL